MSLNPEPVRPLRLEGLKPTPRQVLGAVKRAYDLMQADVAPYETRFKEKGADGLTPQEKARLADFHILTEGRKHVNRNTNVIEIKWDDPVIGGRYVSREGIPVDGLLEYLEEKIKAVEKTIPAGQVTPPEITKQLNNLQKDRDIIQASSLSYDRAREKFPIRVETGPEEIKGTGEEARTRLEAVLTHIDDLRRSESTDTSEYSQENWYKAQRALRQRRRELIIPEQPESQVKPPAQSEKSPETPPPGSAGSETVSQETVSQRQHQPPFLIDELHNPAGEVELSQARKKLGKEIGEIEGFLTEEIGGKRQIRRELAKLVDRKGLTDAQIEDLLIQKVAERLRFQGDFEKTEDQLYRQMRKRGLLAGDRSDRLLMAAESLHYLNLQAENQVRINETLTNIDNHGRYTIAAQEEEGAGKMRLTGGEDIFAGNERKEIPDRDLFAQTLLTEVMMDIPFQSQPDQTGKSFRQVMSEFNQQRKQALIDGDRKKFDDLTQQAALSRQKFYEDIRTVLEKRRLPGNPFPEQQTFKREAYNKLRELINPQRTPDMLDSLLKYYFAKHAEIKPDRQNWLRNKLAILFDIRPGEKTIANFFTYAHEGIDFMERKSESAMKVTPELHKIPKKIRPKIFTKTGPYIDVPHDYEEAESVVGEPGKKGPEKGKPGKPGPDKTKKEEPGGAFASAPAPEDQKPGGEGELPVASTTKGEGEGKGELGEAPSVIEGEKGTPAPPEPAPPGQEATELVKLRTRDSFAAAGLKDRRLQNVLQGAQHEIADDLNPANKSAFYRLKDKLLGWTYRAPLVGGVIRSMAHPIQLIWQNGLAKSVFDQQKIRFVSDVQDILKSKTDASIPVDVSPELLNKAKAAGREMRKKQGFFRRLVWGGSDFVKGILGISQTSEQILAKKWLQEEVNKAPDARDAELNNIFKGSLAEQGRLGDRFARYDNNSGLSFEVSNRLVLSKKVGETRHRLEDTEKTKLVSDKIKSFIAQYAAGSISEDQLLKEVNGYLLGDFQKNLTADQQKEFKAPEVASNILSIARYVAGKNEQTGEVVEAGRWQRYQNERAESGKTMWEEYQLENVLFGQSEWGGVRGKVELGFIADRLARSLAERPGLWNKSGAGGWAIAKDAITNGALFAAGYLTSALTYGSTMPLRMVGGLAGMSAGAALKETGFGISAWGIKGIKGRYVKEVEQLSREVARGRTDIPGAKIREEMKKALVIEQMRDATSLARGIEGFLAQDTLSPEEAKKLLLAMADADARMNLSDLSGSKLLNFKVQNYVSYSQGRENDEYDRLRGALHNGMVRLGKLDIPGVSLRDLNKYSAVAAAQLRFSSEDLKRVKEWVNYHDPAISYDEIEKLAAHLNLGVKKNESLKSKESTLRKLTLKRGVSVAAKAALTGLVAPAVYAVPRAAIGGIGAIGKEVMEFRQEGVQEWANDWKDVIENRNIPIELDPSGQLVSDITPLQRCVLWVENVIAPPIPSPAHTELIDGVSVTLPGDLNLAVKVDGVNHYDAIVNRTTGQVFDMSQFKFGMQDTNGDGKMDLAIFDNSGHFIGDAQTELGKRGLDGVQITAGPDLRGPAEQIDFLKSTGTVEVAVPGIAGHIVKVPEGEIIMPDGSTGHWHAEWRPDAADPTRYDLVPIDSQGNLIHLRDGSDIILVNNAHFGQDGRMLFDDAQTEFHPGVDIKTGEPGTNGNEIWGKAENYRVVHGKAEEFIPIRNDTFATGDSAHPIGVRFRFAENTIHNPNTGAIETFQDAASDGRLGILLQIPHYGSLGEDVSIFVPAHFDPGLNRYAVDFDPTDTVTSIALPDGSHITMAELARNFLNEEKLIQHGHHGELASEMTYEGREFFRLANPDGQIEHQGRILGGYFDEHSKASEYGFIPPPGQNAGAFIAVHAVHGSTPVDLGEIEGGETVISIGGISDSVLGKVPSFILGHTSPRVGFQIPYIPLPMRENIEQGAGGKSAATQTASAIPVTQPVTAASANATNEELAPDRRKELETELAAKRTEKKQIEEKIKSKQDGKATPEQEEVLKKLDKELEELDAQLNPPVQEPSSGKNEENDSYYQKREKIYKRLKKQLEIDLAKVKEDSQNEELFAKFWGMPSQVAEKIKSRVIHDVYMALYESDLRQEEINKLSPGDNEFLIRINKLIEDNQEVSSRIREKMEKIDKDLPQNEIEVAILEIITSELGDQIEKEEVSRYLELQRLVADRVTARMNDEAEDHARHLEEWDAEAADSDIKKTTTTGSESDSVRQEYEAVRQRLENDIKLVKSKGKLEKEFLATWGISVEKAEKNPAKTAENFFIKRQLAKRFTQEVESGIVEQERVNLSPEERDLEQQIDNILSGHPEVRKNIVRRIQEELDGIPENEMDEKRASISLEEISKTDVKLLPEELLKYFRIKSRINRRVRVEKDKERNKLEEQIRT